MESLIAALSSGLTALIGLLIWWVKVRINNRQELATLEATKLTIGQRFINQRYAQTQLTEVRKRFDAHTVLLSKFHNGEYYSDGEHIGKWSVVLQDGNQALADQLQNRLTRNSIIFFGDLKEDDLLICPNIEEMPCMGMKSLLKSLGVKSLIAAMAGECFVMAVFQEEKDLKTEDARWLLQELSSFVQYV